MAGHLAMSQTWTAVPPTPMRLPSLPASVPVNTTAAALSVSRITVTTVTASSSGYVFHMGRPSSTSHTTLEARMNAAT